jgi:SAM-dependent methyltransferase
VLTRGIVHSGQLLGVFTIYLDKKNEFTIFSRPIGIGTGKALLEILDNVAGIYGIHSLWSRVQNTNCRAITMFKKDGWQRISSGNAPGMVSFEKRISDSPTEIGRYARFDTQIHEHVKIIKEAYERNLIGKDPDSPEAVFARGEDKVRLRYSTLCEIDELNGKKVLDFGCGTALLLSYFKEKNIDCEYHGWDISEAMVEIATQRHPEADFKVVDVLRDDLTEYLGYFDIILASGVFNGMCGTESYIPHEIMTGTRAYQLHEKWIWNTLQQLWSLCNKGLAVNFLAEYVDWRDDGLYYCPLGKIIPLIAEHLSKYFTVRRDYELYEFTLYVFKYPKYGL